MCDVCTDEYPEGAGTCCRVEAKPDFDLRTPGTVRHQHFVHCPTQMVSSPPFPVKWQHVYPPQYCDVMLPAALQGRYKLLLPAVSHRGRALHWDFDTLVSRRKALLCWGATAILEGQKVELCAIKAVVRGDQIIIVNVENSQRMSLMHTPGVYMGSSGYRRRTGPSFAPRTSRVIGYTEPPYLINWPEGNEPAEPRPIKSTSSGKGWTVFHCAGSPGESPHTLICIGDTLVEIHQDVQVQIAQTTPKLWFERWSHQQAVCLGDENPNFKHCYLAYSEEVPSTHLLVDHFFIHIHEAVPLVVTLAAAGRVAERYCS